MKSGTVPTKNIARLSTASKALHNRAPGTPGICMVDGVFGLGKSVGTAWQSNQHASIYVRALAMWTPAAMLGSLCKELRLPVGGSNSAAVERIAEALLRGKQTVYMDEVDHIAAHTKMIETLRDFHDLTHVPIVLIGEENCLSKLSRLPRFTSRISQHVTFEPLDEADAAHIARELCEVKIKPELLGKILQDTGGNLRHTTISLATAEQIAKSRGVDEIGLDLVGKRRLFVSAFDAAPARRVA